MTQRDVQGSAVPWRSRPRKPWWDAGPRFRFVQAMYAFPYVAAAATLGVFGEDERPTPPNVVGWVFTAVAVLETVWLVMWFRRPVHSKHET